MTNLQLYSAIAGDAIAKANSTEQGMNDVDTFFDMSVDDVCSMLCGMVAEMCNIQEGDYDTMNQKLEEVKMRQLIDWHYATRAS